jgi:hypothetical protein
MNEDPINDGIVSALDAIREADRRHRAFVMEVSAVVSVMGALQDNKEEYAVLLLERIAEALRVLTGDAP